MRIELDTHVHSVASGHAYSTIYEITNAAKQKGLKIIALTDHGPNMPGAPHLWYFGNLKELPPYINGVRVLKGIEANIIDYEGNIDIPLQYQKSLEFILASFHDACVEPGTVEQHTQAAVKALQNPFVDAIAHPGNAQFQVDIDEVVKAAKKYGKFIEINNHSFFVRQGSEENCFLFAKKCAQHGTNIICGSDSHFCETVGQFEKVIEVLEKAGVPEELVFSTSKDKFEYYLHSRKKRILEII